MLLPCWHLLRDNCNITLPMTPLEVLLPNIHQTRNCCLAARATGGRCGFTLTSRVYVERSRCRPSPEIARPPAHTRHSHRRTSISRPSLRARRSRPAARRFIRGRDEGQQGSRCAIATSVIRLPQKHSCYAAIRSSGKCPMDGCSSLKTGGISRPPVQHICSLGHFPPHHQHRDRWTIV
jgi:hypothetical protein